jgi:hypothetical protein
VDEDDIDGPVLRRLVWMGSSKRNIQAFPEGAQKIIGDELQLIQFGGMPKDAKPFKGIGSGVLRSTCDLSVTPAAPWQPSSLRKPGTLNGFGANHDWGTRARVEPVNSVSGSTFFYAYVNINVCLIFSV